MGTEKRSSHSGIAGGTPNFEVGFRAEGIFPSIFFKQNAAVWRKSVVRIKILTSKNECVR